MLLENIRKWSEKSIVDEILIFALLVAIVESFAQNFLKNANHYSIAFFFGLSIYMLVGYILHFSYNHFPIGKLNTLWSCLSILFAIVIGTVFYKEPLTKNTIISGLFAGCAIVVGSL